VKYNRDAILKFLSEKPKDLSWYEEERSYEIIDRYLREHPDDTEVRDLLLTHALRTPLRVGGGKAMLRAALAHHPYPEARDRLLERALKSEHREILEWGVQELGALKPQERNPKLVKLLASRAEAATSPVVDAFMRDTLAPDDYEAFSLVANSLASRSSRASASTEALWQAMLRLEKLWGTSVLLPYLARSIELETIDNDSRTLSNAILVRRVAERHWNAVGRDLLRAIVDTPPAEWKRAGIERVEFWRHAVLGIALDDVDTAFDHIVHDVLADQDRFNDLIGTGNLGRNGHVLVGLLCVPLSWASPAQLERMRHDLHALAERLPEWLVNIDEVVKRFLYRKLLNPWVGPRKASVGNIVYALRPLVRAMYHALEEKHGGTLPNDYQYYSIYTTLGLLPTLLIDSADDIPNAQNLLHRLAEKDDIEWRNASRAVETSRLLLEKASAWDDSNAAAWNNRVRASEELQAFLGLTTPLTHALWEIAMAGMPGTDDRESVYKLVLNRFLSQQNASPVVMNANLHNILKLLQSLPRNRLNAVRERFAPVVREEFLRCLRDADSWDNNLDFLGGLVSVLHGQTDYDNSFPLLIMPSELLTANPRVVNQKLRSLEATRERELVSALCSEKK
jgi:hypothetical protein